ncbi:hypothetical protein ACJMK2_012925 [Sinanodonta woodiana]|uniref:Transducin beta-like protein 2 n=1 Tax=Sinanodonta woodiana TaxID=1069815 RepID=A0ABD3VBC7_SINWO
MEVESTVSAIAVTAAVGAVVLLLVLLCSIGRKSIKEEDKNETEEKEEKVTLIEKTSKKTRPVQRPRKTQVSFSHPLLASSLKGHSSPILSFDLSPNGKYVITVAEDRSIMLWNTKDFGQKENKFVRGNVELDHATKVKFTPDSKAFIVSLANLNTIRVFRIGKKEDGSLGNISAAQDFPKKHKADIINIGVASNGRFIMTCSSDTCIIVWSIKGDILAEIDTHQMNNSYGAVSPCGRFVASSGFTPDVKVWEVCFSKTGDFQEVKRAFELKGHSAGIFCFCFNNDSTRMASVSKDNTWKYWDTNIQYNLGQDSYLLFTGKLPGSGPCLVALSPDGRTVAIGTENLICLYNAQNGKDEERLENVYSGLLTALEFDITGQYLLSAGDKHVHVLHNVTGYKAALADLREKELKATGAAMKERIRQQMNEARDALQKITGDANGFVESK